MGDLPLLKFRDQLRRRARTTVDNRGLLVLVLSGSFNPVHVSHVDTFHVAKEELEKRGFLVLCSYLAPSSDYYVHWKLGKEAMRLEHRIALCEVVASGTSDVDTCPWGWHHAGKVRQRMEQELRAYVSSGGWRDQEGGDQLKEENNALASQLQVVEICGADFAVKVSLWRSGQLYLCAGRDGSTEQLKRGMAAHILQDLATQKGLDPTQLALLSGYVKEDPADEEPAKRRKLQQLDDQLGEVLQKAYPNFVFVEQHPLLRPLSSTMIRQAMESGDLESLLKDNVITEDVMRYIQLHRHDFAFKAPPIKQQEIVCNL